MESDNINIIKKIKRTILIVDDELVNQEILKSILENDYELLTAENGIDALHIIETSLTPISLILLDINMPIMNGITFIKTIKKDEKNKRIPIIVLTSEKESELNTLELEAVDFIKKPYDFPEIILARVNRSVELSEDRMIIQASERDELTNVYNKHIFIEYANKMDLYSSEKKMDMIVINIERFHLFNELFGKEEADNIMRSFADVLKEIARENEGIVGRLQTDYFMLYLNRQSEYGSVLEKIRNDLSEYNISNIRFRMGVYNVVDKQESVEIRINRAKIVCDEIRNSGINSYIVFDNENQKKVLFNEKLVHDFSFAISHNQFEVYFQPKYDINGDSPKLSSAEALVRWRHPDFGFISPGLFIPLLEENGLIRQLDYFVWNSAAEQIKKWKDSLGVTIPVSVNISRIDLFDGKIVNDIMGILDEKGLSPKDMYLEITETAYNNETEQLIHIIDDFKKKGFILEIDDFGSGYSSLNMLASLSFDVIKLDMAFVRQMENNVKTMKMVEIVADLGHFLNVPVVAEGVETREQMDILKRLGYNIIQGYYFSKPVCAEEFEKLITREM